MIYVLLFNRNIKLFLCSSKMASKMSAVSTLKVKAEIKRLERAKTNAEREKTMCVKVSLTYLWT